MIYDLIAKTINNYLGEGDYYVSYANNHDQNWNDILPSVQDEIKHCVLRVDSGQTTQIGGQTIRTEQLRLIVAIPEARDVFNQAVVNLRSMLNGLNNTTLNDTEENVTALLTFGEYHDAQSQTINGCIWWIAEVTFIANFYDGVYDYVDSKVEIKIPYHQSTAFVKMTGVIAIRFATMKNYDANVYDGNPLSIGTVNSISKTLQIDCVYLKNDNLMTYLLTNEDDIDLVLEVKYYNGLKTRTMNMQIASISENIITGDILKATITFTIAQ